MPVVPGKKGDRHEDGDEHQRGGDDRAGDFLHGVGGGFDGLCSPSCKMALDVFDDDDGVVDDQAGGQGDAEQRERVDEKPSSLTKANVPMSETGMVTAGMMVERQSSRKTKMTRMTRKMAVPRVETTSRMGFSDGVGGVEGDLIFSCRAESAWPGGRVRRRTLVNVERVGGES